MSAPAQAYPNQGVPTAAESDALERCEELLKFAAENIKDVPPEVVSTICMAWEATKTKTWDVKIATDFWHAFNMLCTLIKPVTLDTLSANLRVVPPARFVFWRKAERTMSLSRHTARKYVSFLMILLVIAVGLGFISATAGNRREEIEKHIDAGNKVVDKIIAETDSLQASIGQKKFGDVDPKKQQDIWHLQTQLQEMYYIQAQMVLKDDMVARITTFGRWSPGVQKGTLKPTVDIDGVREDVHIYYTVRQDVTQDLLKESAYFDAIKSILPVILGIMGACAYVIRLISDQIKDNTFSSTSPTRHLVRVALGGLAGVAIGFGGLANAGGLSPSALAFIAGYAVEPVFSTFDGIAEKFRTRDVRKPESSAVAQKPE